MEARASRVSQRKGRARGLSTESDSKSLWDPEAEEGAPLGPAPYVSVATESQLEAEVARAMLNEGRAERALGGWGSYGADARALAGGCVWKVRGLKRSMLAHLLAVA